jgi:hypothetical protein
MERGGFRAAPFFCLGGIIVAWDGRVANFWVEISGMRRDSGELGGLGLGCVRWVKGSLGCANNQL